MTEAAERQTVIDEALSWLRTPYHHAARLKHEGVDCAYFLAEVYHRSGVIPEIPTEYYSPTWHLHRGEERYLNMVRRFAAKVDGDPLPADIAMYRFGRATAHGAIVISWPRIVHAYLPDGCVCLGEGDQGDLAEPGRFQGFYRLNRWIKKTPPKRGKRGSGAGI